MSRANQRIAAAISAVCMMMFSSSCVGPVAIETRALDDARLDAYETFHLTVSAAEGETGAPDEIPVALLEREASALIQERGLRAAAAGASALRVGLEATRDRVVRRTWSADPGYNGYVEREREEGVLTLRLVDTKRALEVWRGESRVRLPDPELLVGPSREAAWMNALAELLDQLPDGSVD